jgi:hypothetical protein
VNLVSVGSRYGEKSQENRQSPGPRERTILCRPPSPLVCHEPLVPVVAWKARVLTLAAPRTQSAPRSVQRLVVTHAPRRAPLGARRTTTYGSWA